MSVEKKNARWWKQFAEATKIGNFPVLSWMLAGACLCGLAISEVTIVRPKRRELERSEAEQTAMDLGQKPKELAGGKLLLPDGRVVQAGAASGPWN